MLVQSVIHNKEQAWTRLRNWTQLFQRHQSLLSGDKIIAEVDGIPVKFYGDPRTQYLKAVLYYHLQHKKKGGQEWGEAYKNFAAVELVPADGVLLRFYRENYCFLSARNAGMDATVIEQHAQDAGFLVDLVEEPLKYQLSGFLRYNCCRYLITQGKLGPALDLWKDAADARIQFYEHLKTVSAGDTELSAAATQVWKMRSDFLGFFHDLCGVDNALFAEVAALADPAFSAAKKG